MTTEHQTSYSAAAFAHLTATAERYREALQTLADGHIFDAPAFAAAVLAGGTAEQAHAADVASMDAPHSPDEQAAFAEGIRRLEARRELVRAALRWTTAQDKAAYDEARMAVYVAAEAFRAAGGSEVMG